VAALVDLVLSIKWWGLARLMDAERVDQQQNAKVDDLLLEGEHAFMNGDRRLAYESWRVAATLDPYNESIWLSLLKVIESEDDRIVCLENVIAINPLNVDARRMLRREQGQPEMPPQANAAPRKPSTLTPIPSTREHPVTMLLRGLLIGIGIGSLGVLLGVVISIIWYGIY